MIHPMFWALSTLPSSPIILLSALSQMTVSHTLDFVMRNNYISNANMILSSCLLLCFNLLLLVLHFQQSSDPSRTNNPLILYIKSFLHMPSVPSIPTFYSPLNHYNHSFTYIFNSLTNLFFCWITLARVWSLLNLFIYKFHASICVVQNGQT